MYLIRLQASERLPVHQCFVDLICQVKVFKDPVHTGSPPGWGGGADASLGWEGGAGTSHPHPWEQGPPSPGLLADSHGWVRDLPVPKAENKKPE